MEASWFEWLFLGGPAELMIGIPILIGVIGLIYAVIRTAFDKVTGK